MEVAASIFIGSAIIALTEAVKLLYPEKVNGAVSIAIAVLVGILVALVDQFIGVSDITVAEGIMIALAASGVVTVAKKV